MVSPGSPNFCCSVSAAATSGSVCGSRSNLRRGVPTYCNLVFSAYAKPYSFTNTITCNIDIIRNIFRKYKTPILSSIFFESVSNLEKNKNSQDARYRSTVRKIEARIHEKTRHRSGFERNNEKKKSKISQRKREYDQIEYQHIHWSVCWNVPVTNDPSQVIIIIGNLVYEYFTEFESSPIPNERQADMFQCV